MIEIRNVYPEIEGGKYPVKTEVDRPFKVTAEVVSEKGISVNLKYKNKYRDKTFKVVFMETLPNDIYRGVIEFEKPGIYEYMVEASSGETAAKKSAGKSVASRPLEVFVEPVYARFGSWYEMFPRSQGKIPGKSATFKDCIERLSEIKVMGFDVVYLTPIHPIGKINRKGPNNILWAGPGDPGCPWSIGDETGGHKAVHPELGSLEDFREFVAKCNEFGMEVALDLALTCSFDHPYIKKHPGWFFHNPDGTIKFAENPPKKYEDTVFLNFYPEDREDMWNEMKSIFLFWVKQGVKIFRIDNPHTKPDEFWFWLIREIKKVYPEVIMLSEAFTYYERLELLAKIGYSQSYTYFTWRNNKNECIEYFMKLTGSYLKDFLRPNFFVNTPDILPKILQEGGRPAFMSRIALAVTTSPSYGMYSGYELCENKAQPNSESYQDSEKYDYKTWDWDRPGNIKDYIAILNAIKEENKALHYLDNLQFCGSTDDNVLSYVKVSPDRNNIILSVVNLNPYNASSARITVPVESLGIASGETYIARELITGKVYYWKGRENYVRLIPGVEPAYIFRIEKMKGERKPKIGSSQSALENAKVFFDLREKAVKKSDIMARRELGRFYNEVVSPRVFTGSEFDQDYADTINNIARKNGFDTIIEAYLGTSGH